MHLKVERRALQKALSKSQPAATTRHQGTTLPPYRLVRIEATANRAQLITRSPEIMVTQAIIEAETISEGHCLIPRDKLGQIAREFPEGPIELNEKKDQIHISGPGTTFRLSKLNEELPLPARHGTCSKLEINGAILKELMDTALVYVSRDEMRPALTGILIETDAQKTRTVATDGHRLIVADAAPTGGDEERILIPGQCARTLVNLIEQEELVRIEHGEGSMVISGDSYSVWALKLNQEYPRYQTVIPKGSANRITAKKEELTSALSRAKILNTQAYVAVELSAGEKTLRLKVANPDLGESEEEVEAVIEGAPGKIGINTSYLLAALESIREEEVTILVREPESPITVEGASKNPFVIIMPVRT